MRKPLKSYYKKNVIGILKLGMNGINLIYKVLIKSNLLVILHYRGSSIISTST
jgi:hypothetical protein